MQNANAASNPGRMQSGSRHNTWKIKPSRRYALLKLLDTPGGLTSAEWAARALNAGLYRPIGGIITRLKQKSYGRVLGRTLCKTGMVTISTTRIAYKSGAKYVPRYEITDAGIAWLTAYDELKTIGDIDDIDTGNAG